MRSYAETAQDTQSYALNPNAFAENAFAQYNSATDAPAPTAFHIAEAMMDEAHQLAYRVQALVDRLCGSEAALNGDGGKGVPPVPSSVFPNLRDKASNTSITIRSAMMALNRLDRELP